MSSRLAGIEAKIGRARMHLEEFKRLSRGYVKSHPYSIRENEYLNDEGFMERAFIIDSVEAVPPDLPLVMGDCVQNLRAALDHLTWQLVLAAGNTPCNKTAFPIFDSSLNAKGNPRNIGVVGGIDPRALAIIKSSQPYNRANGPKDHPLSILHDLTNIDKHRTILLVGAYFDTFVTSSTYQFRGRVFTNEGIVVDLQRSKSLHSGTKLAHTSVVGNTDSLADILKVELELPLQIQFREGERCEGQIVTNTLQQLLHTVRDVVVPSLKPFLV